MFGVFRRLGWKKSLLRAGLALLVAFALAQVIPYGRGHSNPPVTQEPRWNAPATRALTSRACFDCHSNLTVWKWYSNVAPGSWLIQMDVDGGRSQFNFSEWDKPQDVSIGDVVDTISGGSMPPWYYTLLHRRASLSSVEKTALINGLQATFAASPPLGGGG